MPEPSPIAYDLAFHGLVQGVGFRYTAYEIARTHPGVSGWVRNHWDGTVQMHVQGLPDSIDSYLHELIHESRLARLIERVNKKTGAFDSTLRYFTIEH